MEMNNFKQWLELAQQYQADQFWKQIFEDKQETSEPKTNANPFSFIQEYTPKCDLYENDGKLIAEIEIPGIKKDEICISVNQQILSISGEFKSIKTNCRYFLKERANRKFKKELTLPFPIVSNHCSSELIDGVLVITLTICGDETEEIPISFD